MSPPMIPETLPDPHNSRLRAQQTTSNDDTSIYMYASAMMTQKSTDRTTAAANRAIQQALPALKKYEWLQSQCHDGPKASKRRSIFLEEHRREKPDAKDHNKNLLDEEEADAEARLAKAPGSETAAKKCESLYGYFPPEFEHFSNDDGEEALKEISECMVLPQNPKRA